jgi:hypothetical protein
MKDGTNNLADRVSRNVAKLIRPNEEIWYFENIILIKYV